MHCANQMTSHMVAILGLNKAATVLVNAHGVGISIFGILLILWPKTVKMGPNQGETSCMLIQPHMVAMLDLNEAVGVLDNAHVVIILNLTYFTAKNIFLEMIIFSAKFTTLGIQAGAAVGLLFDSTSNM